MIQIQDNIVSLLDSDTKEKLEQLEEQVNALQEEN